MDTITDLLDALDIHGNAHAAALRMLLNPREMHQSPFHEKGLAAPYLRACANNVLAEYWGFLMKTMGNRPGWMDKTLESVLARINGNSMAGLIAEPGEEIPVKLEDLLWNLLIINGRLCVLRNEVDERGRPITTIVSGVHVNDLGKRDGNEEANRIYIMGYVRPYHADLLAAAEFLRAPATIPDILKCVADPRQRNPFHFENRPIDASTIQCNETQARILGEMRHNIEGIQGPPGTGKSTTIFHIVNSMVSQAAVVTCVQNKAVDSIAEKLATSSMVFIVFGNEKNLGPTAARHTLPMQVARDEKVVLAAQRVALIARLAKKATRRLQAREFTRFNQAHLIYRWKLWDGKPEPFKDRHDRADFISSSPWRRWWKSFIGERSGLAAALRAFDQLATEAQAAHTYEMRRAKADLLTRATAALCTIDTASALLYGDDRLARPITIAIIDEAGTIPEHKMPVLARLGVQAVVAIGDQNQLQPFSHVDDKDAPPSGYFHRLARVLPALPMLTMQYRMHPQLSQIVSKAFYRDMLITDPGVAARRTRAEGAGVFWVTYANRDAEEKPKHGFGVKNPTEAGLIETFLTGRGVDNLMTAGKTIMIITFYKAQYFAIKDIAKGLGYDPKDQRLRIVTVDAAQGSEADVVILSCVRSNRGGDIGFLQNKNRMCVAISRARERLVVVGDARTFAGRPVWRDVLAAAARGPEI